MGSFTYLYETPKTSSFTYLDEERKRLSRKEALWLAGRLGFLDTARGIQQLAGVDEETLAEEQRQLNVAMDDPEYGTSVTATYFAGLIADPAGWLVPISRLKHLNTARKILTRGVAPAAGAGAIAGGLGYVDPEMESLVGEGKMGRVEQGMLGAGMGAAAMPVAKGVGDFWNNKAGDAAWNVLKHPSGAGATVGGLAGWNMGENATTEEKIKNALKFAALGAGVGATPKALDKMGVTDDLTGKLGGMIIPDYRLADEWIHGRSVFKGERKFIQGEFESLIKEMSELPLKSRQKLYHMLTDSEAPVDKELSGLGERSRELVNKYGKRLVDLGLLDEKTWTKNKYTYLHRTYNDPERLNKMPSDVNIRHIGDELKMRGYVKDVSSRLWDAGRRPDDKGKWGVVDSIGDDKYRVRRDWSPEERLEMGEVTDAMLAIDRTGKILANDVSSNKFFKDMAVNKNISSVGEPEGDFMVRVPKDKKYGALGDGEHFVTRETMRDLAGINQMNALSAYKRHPWVQKYRKLNQYWKGSKTIANPAVHFNNFVSNIVHYDFANGRSTDFIRAVKDLAKKTDEYLEAESQGVFGGFFSSELGSGADDYFKLLSREGAGATDNLDIAKSIPSMLSRIYSRTKGITWDKMAQLYNAEDQVFRMALYRSEKSRLIANGDTVENAQMGAARKAREWFVDYERTSPVLEVMREGPFPFMSYMYGVIPKIGETAAKKPIKFAKWGLFLHTLNSAGEKLSDESESEIEKQRRLMRGEKSKGWWGLPFMPEGMIKLPKSMSPETRDSWYLNTSRMYPGGDIFQGAEGGVGQIPGLPQWLQPSFGAAGGILWPSFGIKQFTGQPIPSNWGARVEEIGRQFTPNLPIPGFPSYSGSKIDRARSGKYSSTKDVYTPSAAYLSGFGVKVTPVSTRKQKRRIGYYYIRKLKELDAEKRNILSEYKAGGIDGQEKREALQDIKMRRRELQREKRRAMR